MELVVDPWIKDLWVALEKEFLSRAENKEMIVINRNHNIPEVPGDLDMCMHSISIESELMSNSTSLNKAVVDTCKEVEHSLVHSVPPLCQCSLNIPALSSPYLDVLILDCVAKVSLSTLFTVLHSLVVPKHALYVGHIKPRGVCCAAQIRDVHPKKFHGVQD